MKTKIPDGTKFQFGQHTFQFGQEVVELTDSAAIRNNPEALRSRFQEDGYLFIRGFHDPQKSQLAAFFTLDAIADRGGIKEGTPIESGIVGRKNQSFSFFRQTEVAHAKEILDLVDSNDTFCFFERFFHTKKVITFDKRWLRCMANGGCNHFHYDQVYVGRGTPNRCTMWSALTDISLEDGPLVICLGSHQHKKLRETYGKMDMDRDLIDAVFTSDPAELAHKFGFKLATAHFHPGDVVIFGMFMMHSTAPNLSDRYRISIDTRYQPADEEKDDRFFFREDGKWLGNFYNKGVTYKPMDELRHQWGLS